MAKNDKRVQLEDQNCEQTLFETRGEKSNYCIASKLLENVDVLGLTPAEYTWQVVFGRTV